MTLGSNFRNAKGGYLQGWTGDLSLLGGSALKPWAGKFNVNVNTEDADKLSVDKNTAGSGETVKVTGNDGTDVSMVIVTWQTGGKVKQVNVNPVSGNTVTFNMPGGDVLVRILPPVNYYSKGTRTYSGHYTVVTSETTTWKDGWYVVNEDVTINQRIEVQGEVTLLLMGTSQDSFSKLTASAGIHVGQGNYLTVYGETSEYGVLNARNYSNNNDAAIGSNSGEDSGQIIICSGAVSGGSNGYGAGIGGGKDGAGKTIRIDGGTVAAVSISGAGIGGGGSSAHGGGNGSNITINGGSVSAYSSDGAGIGGGFGGFGFEITINGGDVYAHGGTGAGIGGGEMGLGTSIKIKGGNVTATSHDAAGIGLGSGDTRFWGGGGSGQHYYMVYEILGGCVSASSDNGFALMDPFERGHGMDLDLDGYIYLNAKIMGGPSPNPTTVITNDESKVNQSKYIIIKPCEHDHDHVTWKITSTGHTKQCSDCRTPFTEEAHNPNADGICTVCGYNSQSKYVFFDSNGGSEVPAQLVKDGSTATEPVPNPTREGFTFGGWYKVNNGEMVETTFNFSTTIYESITLKAKWLHQHDGITFQPLNSNNSLPDKAGNYYLTGNANLGDGYWTAPEGTTNLCLCGYTISRSDANPDSLINVPEKATLNIYAETGGTIKRTDTDGSVITIGD